MDSSEYDIIESVTNEEIKKCLSNYLSFINIHHAEPSINDLLTAEIINRFRTLGVTINKHYLDNTPVASILSTLGKYTDNPIDIMLNVADLRPREHILYIKCEIKSYPIREVGVMFSFTTVKKTERFKKYTIKTYGNNFNHLLDKLNTTGKYVIVLRN